MFRLVFLLLALLDGKSALRCTEVERVKLLDCSRLNVKETSRLPSPKWVEFLHLRLNKITTINATELLITFPNLRFIYIRNNPNFDCRLAKEKWVTIASDCKLKSCTRYILPRSNVLTSATSTPHIVPQSSVLSRTASTPHIVPQSSVLTSTTSTRLIAPRSSSVLTSTTSTRLIAPQSSSVLTSTTSTRDILP